MEENNRLAGTKGYRLKLYPNGAQSAEPYIVYVSSKDFQRGKKTKEEMLHCFFDLLNSNSGLMEAFVGFGRTARFRRAFMLDGREVKEVSDIVHDMELWISCGEDFIPIECKCKSAY